MFISFYHDPFNRPPAFFCQPPLRPLGHDVPLPSRSVKSLYKVHLFTTTLMFVGLYTCPTIDISTINPKS